jgi:hypothetical protein
MNFSIQTNGAQSMGKIKSAEREEYKNQNEISFKSIYCAGLWVMLLKSILSLRIIKYPNVKRNKNITSLRNRHFTFCLASYRAAEQLQGLSVIRPRPRNPFSL